MDMVTIRRFDVPWQASMAQNRLEQEGIQTFLQQEATTLLSEAMFTTGIDLQVRPDDAERALALIGEMKFSSASEEDEQEDGSLTCLSCGALIPKDASACPKCGWTYRAGAFDPQEEAG